MAFIPFNFQPASTTLRTSSYSIPAGRYAQVFPRHHTCTLNGSSIMRTRTSSNSLSVPNSAVHTTLFQPALEHVYIITWSMTGGVTQSLSWKMVGPGGSQTLSISGLSGSYTFDPACPPVSNGSALAQFDNMSLVALTNSAAGGPMLSYTIETFARGMEAPLWVPTGTTVAGSAFIVTEFLEYT